MVTRRAAGCLAGASIAGMAMSVAHCIDVLQMAFLGSAIVKRTFGTILS
jgi:hypothetical protein